MLCCTAAILWTVNLHWSYLFLLYWAVWYWHKWSNKLVVLPLLVATDAKHCRYRTCLVNIILLVAEIIPDKWCCFSFWHPVCSDFLCCSLFNVVTSDSLHVQGCGLLQHTEWEIMWLEDRYPCRLCMHSVCLSSLLFLLCRFPTWKGPDSSTPKWWTGFHSMTKHFFSIFFLLLFWRFTWLIASAFSLKAFEFCRSSGPVFTKNLKAKSSS